MTIVFKVSDNVKEKMIEYYMDKRKPKTPPYAIFQAVEADTVITLYESGKAMFQGISADVDANLWKDMEKHLNNIDIDFNEKQKEKADKTYYYLDAIGSDEVGTGDYFLPIVVCATYVKKTDIPFLEKLKVHDSKKMTDDKIRRCAPIIMNKLPHEYIVMTNKEYNSTHTSDNMNKIKAILHNQVLYKMVNKGFSYDKVIVDQFAYPRSYYGYLKDTKDKVINITFMTKAEDKNLSVACASVISRYIFLTEMDKLNKKYNVTLPKGAGTKVDEVGKELVKKYGKEILNEISKVSFKNTEKILKG